MVHKVNNEPLDVRAVMVLVGHDHNTAVAKSPNVYLFVVVLPHFESQDLNQVLDLLIVQNLLRTCVSYVKQFSTQRENAETITADHLDASHC